MMDLGMAVSRLADELAEHKYAGMQGKDWNCEQVDALARVLGLAGHLRTAARALTWHADNAEHHPGNAAHERIWEMQRAEGYASPGVRRLADKAVAELMVA